VGDFILWGEDDELLFLRGVRCRGLIGLCGGLVLVFFGDLPGLACGLLVLRRGDVLFL
tara:strand:+ start:101 stop:274 length:174 start_codon:yes stop_codon:yes gene_type:complete